MANIETIKCAQCSKAHSYERRTRPKKFCSIKCVQTSLRRRNGILPIAQEKMRRKQRALKVCPECHENFVRTRGVNNKGGEQVCCSVDCSLARRRRLKPKICDYPKANFCDECRRCIGVKRKYCDDCNLRRMEKACRDCGVVVGKNSQRCDSCRACAATEARKRSRKSPSARASKARSKALRRARKRIATVECFDPYEIFNRDGWRCYICGIETPKRLRGTLDERAPELDHINPIALGGQHSRQNTACCCRKCNAAKGVGSLEQILKAA